MAGRRPWAVCRRRRHVSSLRDRFAFAELKPGVPRAPRREALLGSSLKDWIRRPTSAGARTPRARGASGTSYANGQRHLIEELEKERPPARSMPTTICCGRAPCACSGDAAGEVESAGWSASGPTTCPAATSSAALLIDDDRCGAPRSGRAPSCCAASPRPATTPGLQRRRARRDWLERGERFDELEEVARTAEETRCRSHRGDAGLCTSSTTARSTSSRRS